jgi:hypothetical protein
MKEHYDRKCRKAVGHGHWHNEIYGAQQKASGVTSLIVLSYNLAQSGPVLQDKKFWPYQNHAGI